MRFLPGGHRPLQPEMNPLAPVPGFSGSLPEHDIDGALSPRPCTARTPQRSSNQVGNRPVRRGTLVAVVKDEAEERGENEKVEKKQLTETQLQLTCSHMPWVLPSRIKKWRELS